MFQNISSNLRHMYRDIAGMHYDVFLFPSFMSCVQVNMISAERDGLKKILESYDNEEAVIASHRKPGDKIASLATPEKSKDSRIQVRFTYASSLLCCSSSTS